MLVQACIFDNAKDNPRYMSGELRLDRVYWAYRLCSTTSRDGGKWRRGYRSRHYEYSTFVRDDLAWLLTAFLFVAVGLAARQVGLGTDQLKDDVSFQKASVVLTVLLLDRSVGCCWVGTIVHHGTCIDELDIHQGAKGPTNGCR